MHKYTILLLFLKKPTIIVKSYVKRKPLPTDNIILKCWVRKYESFLQTVLFPNEDTP